jgi:hypothetical protein
MGSDGPNNSDKTSFEWGIEVRLKDLGTLTVLNAILNELSGFELS